MFSNYFYISNILYEYRYKIPIKNKNIFDLKLLLTTVKNNSAADLQTVT